jgi:hypothetical protein
MCSPAPHPSLRPALHLVWNPPMARSIKLLGAIALAATAACGTDPISPSNIAAAPHSASARDGSTRNIVVTESDIARQPDNTLPTRSWVFYTSGPTPTGAFVSGPGNPPLGDGSFEMGTVVSADHGTLFNFDHINTRLDAINAISYATYRDLTSIGAPQILPSINIAIDKNGGSFEAGDFATLVFEPIYNSAQGPVVPGVWQTWDGFSGNWWSTRELPGIVRSVPYTWTYIVSQIPDATILGGFGVNQGSGSIDLVAATDALTLGVGERTWIYDFEPTGSGDGCKNSAKDDERRGDGSSSKGKCKKKNGHDGSDQD